jgi:hypothetical protein
VDEKIRHLLARIGALEDELKTALHQREIPLFYRLNGKRVEFDDAISANHRLSKIGLLRWFGKSRPPTVVVAPVIYGLILPLLFFDLGLTLYQAICFPVCRIHKVKRADYIAMDRGQLDYLNCIEKFNCGYYAYANGLIAYGAEIAARTEQYWCPIKHAHKVFGTHARYQRFIAYGDAEHYPERLTEFREALSTHAGKGDNPDDSAPG